MAEGDLHVSGGVLAAEVAAAEVALGRRPIAALEMEGLTPGDPPSRRPEFIWVRPTTLLVDQTYQRALSDKSLRLIRRIIAGWDWARFKPPVVANTPGGLEVIDGQHTAIAAATHGGIDEIPVMVVGAATVAARAASFVGHNRDRLALTPQQIHLAAVEAGDGDALAVEKAATRAGVRLLRTLPSTTTAGFQPGDCVAFTTLYRLITRRGPTATVKVLKVLVEAECAPVAAWQISAIEALLFDDAYATPRADAESLAAGVAHYGADLMRQTDTVAASHRLTRAKAMAVIIYRRATHGRRKAA